MAEDRMPPFGSITASHVHVLASHSTKASCAFVEKKLENEDWSQCAVISSEFDTQNRPDVGARQQNKC